MEKTIMKKIFLIFPIILLIISCDNSSITQNDLDDQILDLSIIILKRIDSLDNEYIIYKKDDNIEVDFDFKYNIISLDWEDWFDDGFYNSWCQSSYVTYSLISLSIEIINNVQNTLIETLSFESDHYNECSNGQVSCGIEMGEYNSDYELSSYVNDCNVSISETNSDNTLKINHLENFLYYNVNGGNFISILDLSNYKIIYFQE